MTRRQVLLILQILIGSDQNGEPSVFGRAQQFCILQCGPPAFERCLDRVRAQGLTQRHRRALVEQNAQLDGGDGTTRGMRQDAPHLIERHAGKPLDEFVDWDIVLEIFKEGGNGHARPAEQPRSAVSLRILLDGIAGGPSIMLAR